MLQLKKILSAAFLAFAAIVASNTNSQAALLAYEGFDYAVGADITDAVPSGLNGGIGWGGAWGINSGGNTIAGNSPGDTISIGALSYTDGFGNGLVTSGNGGFFTGVGGTSSPFRNLAATRGADGSSTWISFLGVRQGPATNNTVDPNNPYPRGANLSLYNAGSERLAIGNSSPSASVRVENSVWSLIPLGGAGNRVPSTVPFEQASLVLVRIDHIGDSTVNDNAYLWLNPTLGVTPDIGSANAQSIGAFDFTVTRIRPFAGNNSTAAGGQPYAELLLDEIRIGESYLDVTPFTAVPEPSTAAIGLAGLVLLLIRKRK